jgi:DNA (cytosine-5)-methyltransferase 1
MIDLLCDRAASVGRGPVTLDFIEICDRLGCDVAAPVTPHAVTMSCDAPADIPPGTVTRDVAPPFETRRVTLGPVLSLFPGIDILGRGFENRGFCIVRGPDLLWGGEIRRFHVPADVFPGIIGGSPCQDFSKARRAAPTGEGLELIDEFRRVVMEAAPDWFLLENVPQVPDIVIPGYAVQRFDLHASEVGLNQNRLRHFQYGNRAGLCLRLDRPARRSRDVDPCVVASNDRRTWADKCRLQGLPEDFDLPGMTRAGRHRAVGNGVPVQMAEFIALAIMSPVDPAVVRLCACGCGRPVDGKRRAALAACRQRLHRRDL